MLGSTKEKNHKAAVSLPQFHPLWINYQGVVPRRLVHGSSPCQIMAPRVWDLSCHLQMYVGPYNTIINDVLSRIGCWRWCSPHGVHVHVQIGQESVSQDLGIMDEISIYCYSGKLNCMRNLLYDEQQFKQKKTPWIYIRRRTCGWMGSWGWLTHQRLLQLRLQNHHNTILLPSSLSSDDSNIIYFDE